LNAWWSATAYWLVDVYAMATVVLAAALITLWRIRQPARRLAVARWTLLVLLCLPPLALLTRSTDVARAVPDLGLAEPAEVCYCDVSGAAAGGWMPTLATIYATGSGLVVAWLALGALASARLEMRTAEAPASLRTLLQRVVADRSTYPRLRVGGVTQPVALGLLRPTIVLPEWFVETEPEARVEAALAHEWAHLRRGDLWTLAASRLLFVLLFLHPLFYVLRGRIRADQEAIADAEAAGPGGKLAYAEALVGWARRASSRSSGSSLGLLGRSSLLGKRVAMLLDSGFRVEPVCPRGWAVAVRASAAALVIGLSVLASTGVARTALSALIPVSPPAVPHTHVSPPAVPDTHPSAAKTFSCPPESASPRWPGLGKPGDVSCEEGAK
jgi:beta-lactamase regulating signal transducer with metallopeptidase domain